MLEDFRQHAVSGVFRFLSELSQMTATSAIVVNRFNCLLKAPALRSLNNDFSSLLSLF